MRNESTERPVRTKISYENLSLIGVPKKFHDSTIEDFHTYDKEELNEVKLFINEYLKELVHRFMDSLGLFLFGSNGVGKSFIACLIVKEAYRRRFSARRLTFVEYIDKYTRVWGAKTPEEKEHLEELFYGSCKSVEFLVIEEVGKEIDTKVATPILEDLLRYREDKGLVTVICTNLSPKAVEDKYGASVFSLIKGNMTPIKIEGIDKREDFYKERG
jgi:DNA replication protein DnaC